MSELNEKSLTAATKAVVDARNYCRMIWGEDCTTSSEVAHTAVAAYLASEREQGRALRPRVKDLEDALQNLLGICEKKEQA